jgi:hypothetical protein
MQAATLTLASAVLLDAREVSAGVCRGGELFCLVHRLWLCGVVGWFRGFSGFARFGVC